MPDTLKIMADTLTIGSLERSFKAKLMLCLSFLNNHGKMFASDAYLSLISPLLKILKMRYLLALFTLIVVSITSFALNPSREYKFKPEKYGMQYKEEKIPTKDGASLNAWFFE